MNEGNRSWAPEAVPSKQPVNYRQHIESICLFALNYNDNPIIKQIKIVKIRVKERLTADLIQIADQFIYQCSINYLFMFYFEDCEVENGKFSCPLCGQLTQIMKVLEKRIAKKILLKGKLTTSQRPQAATVGSNILWPKWDIKSSIYE
ncbi:unnamed protein product, partial [Didymodactylos carnosus]